MESSEASRYWSGKWKHLVWGLNPALSYQVTLEFPCLGCFLGKKEEFSQVNARTP